MTTEGRPDRIYHVAFAADWSDAQASGTYNLSTRGRHLDDVGYIHGSFAHQVHMIAAAIYGDAVEPVVVLAIDPSLLSSPVAVENLEGGVERFPHIYGPLPTRAVVNVLPVVFHEDEVIVVGLTRP